MRRRRKTDLARAKEKADKAWAYKVKERAGFRCEKCGARASDAHHVVPRTNHTLRHELKNGVALCRKHHLYWAHKDPLDFVLWLEMERPDDHYYLCIAAHRKPLSQNRTAQDYLDIAASLAPDEELAA